MTDYDLRQHQGSTYWDDALSYLLCMQPSWGRAPEDAAVVGGVRVVA